MNTPPIVSPQEWEAARLQLLVKEKELTRARDDEYGDAQPSGEYLDQIRRASKGGDAT